MRYRYYNPTSATWSEGLYSLDDLAKDAFFNDDTMLATEDGQRTLTYKQAMQNFVGRGNYPKHTPIVLDAQNDMDQKYTNYWIRTACKWWMFFVVSGLFCSVLAGLLALIMKHHKEYSIIVGCLLGVILALYYVRRTDRTAKSAANEQEDS